MQDTEKLTIDIDSKKKSIIVSMAIIPNPRPFIFKSVMILIDSNLWIST